MHHSIFRCEVCTSTDVHPVLDLGRHPLCDDLLPIGASNHCEEFPIQIALCSQCLTALQMHPVPKRKLFPPSYHYRSAMTQDVLSGMQQLVAQIERYYGALTGKTVLDVGCNDGSLLTNFRRAGARVFGIEPTGAAADAVQAGIEVWNMYFDPASATVIKSRMGFPDFITFTNVFAHIENVDEMLAAVQILLGPHTRLVVENHYLGAVLARHQFDTFYHEHPRTYSLTSFDWIARRLNRVIERWEFPSRYGGNIRVVIGPGPAAAETAVEVRKQEREFPSLFPQMRAVIDTWLRSREQLLAAARSGDGKIYAKAFPGRSAIMIRLLGLTEKDVEAVFEKPGSKKIGHYVPGTRIPIVSDAELLRRIPEPRRILNLAWHISSEIRSYLQALDPGLRCVDIFSNDRLGDDTVTAAHR